MPNKLAAETSPYLLQHVDNPVDWYPWGEEAFALARERDVPVLLSVGYSACHWCHVMAHESFEDDATADVMNSLFVNIKVDREERPDVDKIYQLAHQLLTQRGGGWPLTMFLNPVDQRPFFGGTYFPKTQRYGMPAFMDLLHKVASYYREQRAEIEQQGQQLSGVMDRLQPQPGGQVLDDTPLQQARDHFASTFDRDFGGFGSAPKFPHPTTIDFLLCTWRVSANDTEPDLDALLMATLTLKRMADGGLFDHLGGGFCRYSVDRYWQIPHFEKMLYDNGPLLASYAQAYLACGETQFADIASRTADWMLADMRAANGGFFSSRDADSEGVEGKFYVWQPDEAEALLSPQEFTATRLRYGLDSEANFEGSWHLTIRRTIDDIATELDATTAEIQARLESARKALLDARDKRVAPGRDEKQIVSWNALAIRGFSIAGRVLDREDLVDAAFSAVQFVRSEQFVDDRLLSVYKDGKARFPAYLDDYAFLLDALLELLQARWCGEHLEFACQLADILLEYFEDAQQGGFWFTANDHELLMHRSKPLADEAMPSGNGIAALALQRLGFLLGETRYLEAAQRTLAAAAQAICEYPHGHVSLLNALSESHSHPEIIVIRGSGDELIEWSTSAAKVYAPGRLIFAIPADEKRLPGALAGRAAMDGETVAYVCRGSECDLPVKSWRELANKLKGR